MLYNEYNLELPGQSIRKSSVCYLNIIVIGDSGLGKTTFIRKFYHYIKDNILEGTFKKQTPPPLTTTITTATEEIIIKEEKEEIEEKPLQTTKEPYTISMHLRQKNNQRICLSILDTPGFNEKLSIDHQLEYFTKYIDHQYERTFIEETKLKRDAKISDSHIHACIYFLNTTCNNELTDIDVQMLKHLTTRVNVIPIIGKTDTIPTEQLKNLKRNFRRFLFDIFKYPLYGFIHLDDGDDDENEVDAADDDDDEDDNNNNYVSDESISGSKTLDQIIEALISYSKDDDRDDDYDDDEVLTMIDYLRHMPFNFIGQPTMDHHYHDRTNTLSTTTVIQSNHCQFDKLMELLLSKHRDLLRVDTFKRFYERYRIDKLLNQRIYEMITIKSRGKKLPLI